MEIKELLRMEEFNEAYRVMNQLRIDLSLKKYTELLEQMRKEGYRLFAVVEDGEIRALAGIIQMTTFYYGNHLYVYDLITDEDARSKGYGERLLSFVHELGRDLGCQRVVLSSGKQRIDAHRFYEEKMGYDRVSYVFTKNL
ncbi:GNAT family N-acetyltransferase [Metabacillus arenae]|uniref:GNAT family N-acetyltransferase n=1 Tax=Metabacillus arenae TaxID=2771434 RepID=A0A926RXV4_9BACI|nr:GNAT family N-acetyltransferase [Metabacillus arenae]MBD1382293.1 GNAT family N-acetyltransferase [Metabacillus arenae]